MKKTNKILAFGIVLCMLFSLAVVPVGADTDENDTEITDFLQRLNKGSLTNFDEIFEISEIYGSIIPMFYLYDLDDAEKDSIIFELSCYHYTSFEDYQHSLAEVMFLGIMRNYVSGYVNVPQKTRDFLLSYGTSVGLDLHRFLGLSSSGQYWICDNLRHRYFYYDRGIQRMQEYIDYSCDRYLMTYLSASGPSFYGQSGYTLDENEVLDIGEIRGYIDTGNSYVKAGDRKITGNDIYFTNEGKMRLGAGYTAKVERDNGDGTTSQGFMVGMENPRSLITMTLEVTGTANDVDYTGRTISKDFDFTNYEVTGLVNFGFTVTNIPKPLSLSIQSIE